MRFLGLIIVVFLCLGLVACGDEDSTAQSGKSGTTTSESQAQAEEPDPADPAESDAPIPTGDPGRKLTKPSIQPPSGPPPKEIVIVDLVEGTGPVGKKGDKLTVEYFAVDKTGKQRFSSWGRGTEPYTFELGADEFLPAWDEGVEGMRVGGRREMILPASGTNESGDLYYVVDLLKVK